MSSVSIHCAEMADKVLVGPTVRFQPLTVTRAELHLVNGGVDHLVCLARVEVVVKPEVLLTVGGDAHDTRSDGLLLTAGADVTLHIPKPSVAVAQRSSLEAHSLQPLHQIGKHGVLVESWPGVESLPALGAAVDSFVVI